MLRSDFSYLLPPELIAQQPRARGASRMMVIHPGDGPPALEHQSFASIAGFLDPSDVLVLNDTRVIPARLFAMPTGSMTRRIELLLTRRLDGETWEAWCKPARRVKVGDQLQFSDRLSAEVMARSENTVTVRFRADSDDIDRLIDEIGVMPLPPYIAREQPQKSDRESYQTVYAAERGAIAAPTAGLHFTEAVLEEISAKGVEIVRITLHVGIGTFKPVKADDVRDHRMETERYEISGAAATALNRARAEGRRIVAVGTTTVRTLESAIDAGGEFSAGRGETSIFITPGFEFRAVDRLLTNFHLPESTLIMLVSAFAGPRTVRLAYEEAIRRAYLFYSYGDCMLIRNRGRW